MRHAFVRFIVPVAAAAALAGGALVVVRAFTGKGLVTRVRERLADWRAASRATKPAKPAGQAALAPPSPPADPIDEASWESFPASDPPATGQFETPR